MLVVVVVVVVVIAAAAEVRSFVTCVFFCVCLICRRRTRGLEKT